MPCQSDYLAANDIEVEGREVCKLLMYVSSKLIMPMPEWVEKGSKEYYGPGGMNSDRTYADKAVAMLCSICRDIEKSKELADDIIYNGRDRRARALAGWWQAHQLKDKFFRPLGS